MFGIVWLQFRVYGFRVSGFRIRISESVGF